MVVLSGDARRGRNQRPNRPGRTRGWISLDSDVAKDEHRRLQIHRTAAQYPWWFLVAVHPWPLAHVPSLNSHVATTILPRYNGWSCLAARKSVSVLLFENLGFYTAKELKEDQSEPLGRNVIIYVEGSWMEQELQEGPE